MASFLFALRSITALSALVVGFGVVAGFFTQATSLGFSFFMAGSIVLILAYGSELILEHRGIR